MKSVCLGLLCAAYFVVIHFSWWIRLRNLVLNALDMRRAHVKHRRPVSHPKPVHHKFSLTLTSSPSRIRHGISEIFAPFHPDQIYKIYLNLPHKFRNLESYDEASLEQLKAAVPNLEIVWHPTDLGPDLKLIGGLRVAGPDEILVVMDDDTLYPNTLIQEYDQVWQNIDQNGQPNCQKALVTPLIHDVFNVTLHPGFASFSLRRCDVDLAKLEDRVNVYKSAHKRCKRHDDFTLGAALYDLGFTRVQGPVHDVIQLTYGFDADALHMESISSIKHVICAHAIHETRQECPSKLGWTLKDGVSDQYVRWAFASEFQV